ncbi:MAG: HAD hydrolase-like protein [Devosiaceae bacterium]|nr:HAD hydrolase-like protein [Devosiaceae bacterium]
MTLKALIFDVDGTLAETEEAHREAFNQTFKANKLDWHWDIQMYGELLKTTGGKERMQAYQDKFCTPDRQLSIAQIAALHKEKTVLYGDLIAKGTIQLRSGIVELIEDAKQNNIRVAVATTTNRPNVDCLALACFGKAADEIFDVIAAGDEVQHKKPASDVFDLAVSRLGLKSDECVGLEDSRNGLLSCTSAGVPCLVCPGVYTLGADFSEAKAVISSFEEASSIAKIIGLLG